MHASLRRVGVSNALKSDLIPTLSRAARAGTGRLQSRLSRVGLFGFGLPEGEMLVSMLIVLDFTTSA